MSTQALTFLCWFNCACAVVVTVCNHITARNYKRRLAEKDRLLAAQRELIDYLDEHAQKMFAIRGKNDPEMLARLSRWMAEQKPARRDF